MELLKLMMVLNEVIFIIMVYENNFDGLAVRSEDLGA